MNIEKYIEKNCKYRNEDSDEGIHDRAFERHLRLAHELFKNKSLEQLKVQQMLARNIYRFEGNTHSATAKCLILMEMINELEKN